MKVFIVTGTSRGLGAAIKDQLIAEQHMVFSIARNKVQGDHDHLNLIQIEANLDCVEGIEEACQSLGKGLDEVFIGGSEPIEGLYLINNAATIQPMALAEDCDISLMQKAYNLNVVAPSALTGLFIKKTQNMALQKRIINISSGAGKRPFEGWSTYCGTKAALDLFTRTVAKEQEAQAQPIEVVSFSPGVIDTGLQAEIRSTTAEQFPNVEQFLALKAGGHLRKASSVAAVIIGLLQDSEFETGALLDIKTYD